MNAENWIDLIGITSGLIIFSTGLRQYAQSQKWKRAEFVANQMEAFEKNSKISLALKMLDWNERTYKFPIDENNTYEKVKINDKIVINALTNSSSVSNSSETEAMIRDCFDELFNDMDRFEHFIQAGLVTEKDLLPYLKYWCNILSDNKSKRKPKEFQTTICEYLKKYQFLSVLNLLHRFNDN